MRMNKPTSQELKAQLEKIVKKMEGLNKSQRNFIPSLLILYLSLCGRYNFLGMSRYGSYSEQSYRNHFRKRFDWFEFNWNLIEEHLSQERILVFDPSYISESFGVVV